MSKNKKEAKSETNYGEHLQEVIHEHKFSLAILINNWCVSFASSLTFYLEQNTNYTRALPIDEPVIK